MTGQMTTKQLKTDRPPNDGRQRGPFSPRRAGMAAILVAIAAAAYLLLQTAGTPGTVEPRGNDLYMPVVDPILEPDRPDLIGDSLADE